MDKKDLSKKGGAHAGSSGDEYAEFMQRVRDEPDVVPKKEKDSIAKSR